jgi:hypothetical protein
MLVDPADLEIAESGVVRIEPGTPSTTLPSETTTISSGPEPVYNLPSGLFCRDLVALGYSYPEAMEYWFLEGEPDRMDTDLNGIPCETVYSPEDVAAFWGESPPTPEFNLDVLTDEILLFLEDRMISPGYGGKVFCAVRLYGEEQSGTKAEGWMWQFCAEYYPVGDHIELGAGEMSPVVLRFTHGERGWMVTDLVQPDEGEGYGDSIRAMFPPAVADQVLADAGVLGPELEAETASLAEDYFGLPYAD